MAKGKDKRARIPIEPRVEKRPVVGSDPDNDPIAWRIGQADLSGPWAWAAISGADAAAVHAKLAEIEKLKWGEACSGGTPVAGKRMDGAAPEAHKRHREVFGSDPDVMYAIRLSGKKRVWGIREGRLFSLIWWDPEHTVWPSDKKHT